MRRTIEIRSANVEKADFLHNVNDCYAIFIAKRQSTSTQDAINFLTVCTSRQRNAFNASTLLAKHHDGSTADKKILVKPSPEV